MNIVLYIIALSSVVSAIALTLIFIQFRGYLVDYYANANHTGVEISEDEYEQQDYLNDDASLANVLNNFNHLMGEVEKLKSHDDSKSGQASNATMPSSFLDLFETGTEALDENDRVI